MISQIDFVPGDIVQVHQKVTEGDKTRIQIFEGVILALTGRGENKMFTVRKIVGDIAIERIFPINSPSIDKAVVKGHIKEKVNKAKLFHLRQNLH